MAWSTFTTAQMDAIARQLFMPLILMVNYPLFQYLVVFYWSRRREWRVALLFTVGAIGVLCLIPFANPDDDTVGHLNDVSESCCVLSFLIQITIIGRDLNRKIKFKTVLWLTYLAETLMVADLAMMLLSLVVVFKRDFLTQSLQEDLPNICENITLAYIFLFRFYYVVASRGWKDLWENRKLEFLWYLLFALHEVPFDILQHASGLDWTFPQALGNRVTLMGCLFITARSKIIKSSSRQSGKAPAHTVTATPSAHQLVVQPRSSLGASPKMASVTGRASKAYVVAAAASRRTVTDAASGSSQ